MGWLFTHQPRAELIRDLLAPSEGATVRLTVLEHHETPTVLWCLVQLTAKVDGAAGLVHTGDTLNFIQCHLLESDATGWGYKCLDENAHPYYYDCPLRFLDRAPVQSESWRATVREIQSADQGLVP